VFDSALVHCTAHYIKRLEKLVGDMKVQRVSSKKRSTSVTLRIYHVHFPNPCVQLVMQCARKKSNSHVAIGNLLKGDTILTPMQEPTESNWLLSYACKEMSSNNTRLALRGTVSSMVAARIESSTSR
jgi:hypothetical protein